MQANRWLIEMLTDEKVQVEKILYMGSNNTDLANRHQDEMNNCLSDVIIYPLFHQLCLMVVEATQFLDTRKHTPRWMCEIAISTNQVTTQGADTGQCRQLSELLFPTKLTTYTLTRGDEGYDGHVHTTNGANHNDDKHTRAVLIRGGR